MSRINDLKKENQLLAEQASIKKTLLENDRRYGKPTLEAMLKLTDQILDNEEKIARLKKLDETGEKLSLEKQIERLQKSGLGAMKKKLGLDGQLTALQKIKAKGTEEEVKQANKFANLLNDVNSGSKDISDILSTIATEDFGLMNDYALKLGEKLQKYPEIMEDLGNEKKFADMIDQVQDTLGLIDLKKTFTFAGALAAAVSLAKETARVRQELGLSVSESAGLATKTTILSNAFSIIGGEGEEILNFSKGIASEFGNISELSFKTLTNF